MVRVFLNIGNSYNQSALQKPLLHGIEKAIPIPGEPYNILTNQATVRRYKAISNRTDPSYHQEYPSSTRSDAPNRG